MQDARNQCKEENSGIPLKTVLPNFGLLTYTWMLTPNLLKHLLLGS